MFKALMRQPLFIIGSILIILLLTVSIIHQIAYEGYVPEKKTIYNDQNQLIATNPFTPEQMPPFGSTRAGKDLLLMIIAGAKWTIGVALITAFLRTMISFAFGVFYGSFLMKMNKYVAGIINAFYYVPTALIAYLLLTPVLFSSGFNDTVAIFQFSFWERIIYEILVLTIIALPTTSLLFGNETNNILNKEFISSVKTIGGRRLHILDRHVIPHLKPKLIVNYFEQVIQVLIVLVHLGLLHLFIGGTAIIKSLVSGAPPIYVTLTGEWSGLVGASYRFLSLYPWIPLVTLSMFAVTILAFNYIQEGLKRAITEPQLQHRRKRKKSKVKQQKTKTVTSGFEFVTNKQNF